jgi:hypothetical protein
MKPQFIENAVYESTSHGLVKYLGLDCYMGQTTLMFESIKYNRLCYWLPKALKTGRYSFVLLMHSTGSGIDEPQKIRKKMTQDIINALIALSGIFVGSLVTFFLCKQAWFDKDDRFW